MKISGSSKINFGQQHMIQKLGQREAVKQINHLLGKLQECKVVLVIQGSCNAGKSTFIKKIMEEEIRLAFPSSQIAHIEGNYFEDLVKNLNTPNSLRPPYDLVQKDIGRYRDINGPFTAFERTALFFQANQDKLFYGNPFSMILYERGDADSYLSSTKTILNEYHFEIDFPNMVGVFVTVVRELFDIRHFDIYVRNI